jgi:hypothetical protein
MPGSEVKAGAAYVEIGGKDAKLAKALAGAKRKVANFGKGIETAGKSLMKAGAVMAAPVIGSLAAFTRYGDDVAKTARRLGLTTEAVSELGYAATITGADAKTFEKAFKGMSRVVFDAKRELQDAEDTLEAAGVKLEELDKLTPEQQFLLLADRIGKMENATLKAAVAQRVFGRAGMQLIPLMNQGAAGIDKLRARARELGISVSGKDAVAAEELRDAWTDVKLSMLGASMQIAKALLPATKDLLATVIQKIVAFAKWIAANKEAVILYVKITALVFGIGVALLALGKIIAFVMMLLTPAGALGLAVAGLFILLDALGVIDVGFSDFVGNVRIGGVKIKTWLTAVGLGILRVWEGVVNWLANAWDALTVQFRDVGSVLFRIWVRMSRGMNQAIWWLVEKVVSAMNWMIRQLNSILPDKWSVPEIGTDSIRRLKADAKAYYDGLEEQSLKASDDRWRELGERKVARDMATQKKIEDLRAASEAVFAEDIAEAEAKKRKDIVGKAVGGFGGAGTDLGLDFGKGGDAGKVFGTFSGKLAARMIPQTRTQEKQLDALKKIVVAADKIVENTDVTPAAQFG